MNKKIFLTLTSCFSLLVGSSTFATDYTAQINSIMASVDAPGMTAANKELLASHVDYIKSAVEKKLKSQQERLDKYLVELGQIDQNDENADYYRNRLTHKIQSAQKKISRLNETLYLIEMLKLKLAS